MVRRFQIVISVRLFLTSPFVIYQKNKEDFGTYRKVLRIIVRVNSLDQMVKRRESDHK